MYECMYECIWYKVPVHQSVVYYTQVLCVYSPTTV